MCGIAAIISKNNISTTANIRSLIEKIHHRGPDANGHIELGQCQLGHARLSIIDLSSGQQPMCDAGGKYWITFNGEIYNFQELRQNLEQLGHRFNTHSDTEVILASFIEWGSDCVNKFRGMFAFAIWNTEKRELFAARDIFGEKPLYYALLPDHTLVICSDLDALLTHKEVSNELDMASIDAYLAYGYIPPNRTVYKNIATLPPAHTMSWSTADFKTYGYWTPQLTDEEIDIHQAQEQLQYYLSQSLKRQIIADVPVGAFLSGGLDSSTVVAFMQQQTNTPIKTFSVGFGDNINELNYARDVAKKYNTEHHEIDLGTPDVAKMLVEMSNVYNEPFADSSHIPTYLISKYARQFVKVVLTGDGADELFGGYSYYKDLISSYDITYNFAKYYFYKILVMATNYSNSNLYNQYHNYYLARISDDMYSRTIGSRTAIDRKERKKLWGKNANRDQEYDFYDSFFTPRADTSGLNRAFYFDLKSYMPGDILVKVDRAAMANSIETRAPFLDRDFAEFALTLPYRLKTSRNDTKMIFKSSFSNYWPESLKTRGKQGFGAPYRHWLTFKDVKDLSLQIFHKDSKLLKLLPGIQPAQASEQSYKTWILLNLGLWLENRDISI